MQFPLYELLKARWARHTDRKVLPAHEAAVCGSVSGGVAAALTTPLDVLKTRVMLDLRVRPAIAPIFPPTKCVIRGGWIGPKQAEAAKPSGAASSDLRYGGHESALCWCCTQNDVDIGRGRCLLGCIRMGHFMEMMFKHARSTLRYTSLLIAAAPEIGS